MAIKLPPKPSNKAKTLAKIGESSWGEHQIPTPFIDRLTVVYHPQDDAEANDLYKAIHLHLNDKSVFYQAPKGSKGDFGFAKKIVIDSVADMKHWPLFQWSRHFGTQIVKTVRLEFVPKDLGVDGVLALKVHLQGLGLDWASLLKFGNVSRIDVAVDFSQLSMADFFYLPKQAAKTTHWFGKGYLETIVSGLSSGNQTSIYDRGKKREDKNQYGYSGVRVERRLRNTKKKLIELPNLANPFGAMTFVQSLPPAAPNNTPDGDWTMFSDSVSVRGLENALQLLSVKDRTKYRAHIIASKSPNWKPDAIWSKWHQSLADIELMKPLI